MSVHAKSIINNVAVMITNIDEVLNIAVFKIYPPIYLKSPPKTPVTSHS